MTTTTGPKLVPQGAHARPTPEWEIQTLEDALTGADEPFDWVIEDVLLKHAAALVSGQPHAGKSLDMLAAALESVTHHTVWGHFKASNVRRVLFIETEDPKQVLRKRIRQIATGLKIDTKRIPEGFFWVRTGPFDLVKAKDKLRGLLDKYKPDWVVISTLQGLLGPRNWKEQADMSDVNALIVELANEYCPIVLITHSPQDKQAKRAAGSITQEANYLTTAHFEKQIKDDHTRTLVTLDSKLGEPASFALTLETEDVAQPDGKHVREVRRVVYAAQKPPADRDLILAMHKDHPEASVEEIAREVGCSQQYVRLVLRQKQPEAMRDDVGTATPKTRAQVQRIEVSPLESGDAVAQAVAQVRPNENNVYLFTVTEIVQQTRLPKRAVELELKRLGEAGIVEHVVAQAYKVLRPDLLKGGDGNDRAGK